ncbi:hypothetical protein P8452_54078 [Trifolium repens]|nr:hypothetical protein P8452_54078 [Trifolium repens]
MLGMRPPFQNSLPSNGELSLSKLQATVIHVSVVAKEVTGLSQSKGDNVFIKYTDGFRAKNPVDGLYAFDMPLLQ